MEIQKKGFKEKMKKLGYSIKDLSTLLNKKPETIYMFRHKDEAPHYVWLILHLLEELKDKQEEINSLKLVIEAQGKLISENKN